MFPEAPRPESCSRCSDAGVLGVVPGIVGTLQVCLRHSCPPHRTARNMQACKSVIEHEYRDCLLLSILQPRHAPVLGWMLFLAMLHDGATRSSLVSQSVPTLRGGWSTIEVKSCVFAGAGARGHKIGIWGGQASE